MASESKEVEAPAPTPARAEAGSSLMWVEKYRPETLDDLISHEHIIGTINKLIEKNRMPHLLLYGPPGTGKTSTILAIARKLFGRQSKLMTLELNASDDRGIDVVREQIKDFAGTKVMGEAKFKLIILDEADAMTSDAQFALRRVIEKYTRNARFCLICNYVSKIIPALQSRCTRFRFAPLQRTQIETRLRHIISMERVDADDSGIRAILRLSGGDMRRVLNILQATAAAHPRVTEDAVYACTGDPSPRDINTISQSLMNDSFSDAFRTLRSMQIERGLALGDILTDISKIVCSTAFPPLIKIQLLDALSSIEFRLTSTMNEKTQAGAVVAAFILARDTMTRGLAADDAAGLPSSVLAAAAGGGGGGGGGGGVGGGGEIGLDDGAGFDGMG